MRSNDNQVLVAQERDGNNRPVVTYTRFPKVKLTCIGEIVAGQGVLLRDKTGMHQLPAHNYTHFDSDEPTHK